MQPGNQYSVNNQFYSNKSASTVLDFLFWFYEVDRDVLQEKDQLREKKLHAGDRNVMRPKCIS